MKEMTVGITMGDPAGVGPEIVVKALLKPEIHEACRPVVIGDAGLLKQISGQHKLNAELQTIKNPRKASDKSDAIRIIDLHNLNLDRLRIGETSREAGRASIEYIEVAVRYALDGELDAIATAPINKESLRLAGSAHIGHTELIGSLTKTEEPVTMFWVRGVAIFFLTRHLALKRAIEAVEKERIATSTVRIDRLLRGLGFKDPCIAIAALNPHASDGGLMGEEEEREIIPAVKEVRERGINAVGPVPADAVFHQAFSGKYNAVLSLYHDQGHIPAKTVDFYGAVSVTLGLPFVRTSVDHGTAFDIAGKGVANSKSLEEAIKAAAVFALKLRSSNEDQ